MVVDDLYYKRQPCGKVSSTFSFDEQTVKDAIRRIYEKKIDPLTEIDEGVFNETWNLFNSATDEGFGQREYSDPDYMFYQELRYNNAVFSAFRTHRLQNDIASKLLDEDGKLKSFEKFSADIEPIADHNVKNWLRTEYDTAVIRAHRASDWRQFAEVSDVLPNLRWLPTTSVTPDLVHKRYWEAKLTLPQNHPFWAQHAPGDRWNCKCSLEATDDPIHGAHVIEDKDQPNPDKGLDNNPGQDAMLFSFSHPYFAAGYWAYKKLAPVVKSFIEKQMSTIKTNAYFSARLNATQALKGEYNKRILSVSNLQTGTFYDSKKGLKNLIAHSYTANEINAAMSMPKNIKKLNFVRVSPLGEGKDMSNSIDKLSIDKKIERGVKQYNIYEYKYKWKTYYVKLEESAHGEELLYSFTKKP